MSKGKKKKGRGKKEGLSKKILTGKVIGVFTNNPDKVFNYKQIAKKVNADDEPSRALINAILIELRDLGSLVEIGRGKYKIVTREADILPVRWSLLFAEQDILFLMNRTRMYLLHNQT